MLILSTSPGAGPWRIRSKAHTGPALRGPQFSGNRRKVIRRLRQTVKANLSFGDEEDGRTDQKHKHSAE